jgi:prepilin peptidase CpaA
MTFPPGAAEILLPVLLLAVVWIALAFDLYQRRIPNALTFGATSVAVVLQSVLGGASGLLMALAGLVFGLIILLPGYLLRATGAGDVKLMAATGTFLGPFWVLAAGIASILVGALIAGVFAASTLVSRTFPAPWPRYRLMLKALVTTGRVSYVAPAEGEVMGRRLPFAVSIALGTTLILVLWWPELNAQWAG